MTMRTLSGILIASLLIGLVFVISIGFITTESDNHLNNKSNRSSELFDSLYFALTSQKVDKAQTEESIKQLKNDFERDFLTALLLKRNQKFDEAFDILYKNFTNPQADYKYYTELVSLALITDNLYEIEKALNKNKLSKYSSDFLKALIFYNSGKYNEAIKLLENQNDYEAVYLLAHCYRALGNYQKSFSLIDSVLNNYPKSNPDYCRFIISKGSLLLLSNRIEDAKMVYETGYEIAKANSNKKEELKALVNLAIIDDYAGEIDAAQSKLSEALSLAKEIEDLESEALVYSETGVSFTYSGDIVSARKNYEKSFELYKKLKNSERLANLSSNIGLLYVQTANFSSAITAFEEGLNYANENVVSKILNLRGLGDTYSNLSNYAKALDYYQQAKELSEKINNADQKAISQISIGTLFYNLGRPKHALELFKEVEANLNSISDPYIREDLFFKLALAYSDIDSFDTANEYFEKSFSFAQNNSDIYYEALIPTYKAYTFIRNNKYSEAERTLNFSKQKSKEYGFDQLSGLQNLFYGLLNFKRENFSSAKKYLQNAYTISLQSNDFNTAIEAKYYQAFADEKTNNLTEAEQNYLTAIDLIEKISSGYTENSQLEILHFAGLKDSYLRLTNLYLRKERFEDAFNTIEKFRARNIFKNLNEIKLQNAVDDKILITDFYDLQWKLNSGIYSNDEKDSLLGKINSVRMEIIRRYNFNSEYKTPAFNVNRDLVKLYDNECFISYYLSDNGNYAFLLNKGEFIPLKLYGNKETILEIVTKISPLYDHSLIDEEIYYNQDLFSFNAKAAHELYKILIQPFEKLIGKNSKLIFSLPVELSVVPMEFLVSKFNEDESPYYFDDKKFLIEDFSISYAPSVSVYLMQKEKLSDPKGELLLVGDPQISNSDFALSYRGSLLSDQNFSTRNIKLFPLKYSRDEIQKIKSMYAGTTVLLASDASEKIFIENVGEKSVIHLSTHSFVHNNQPFIILSQTEGRESDGFLEMGEILNLQLNSELVVLSSCKSGLGSIDATEGIIGMQKSFFEAGAKSIVVSLWDVNDKYTSLFMQSFYGFLGEGYDKAEALRKAKLFFKENYSANPYYWAAFVLSGDNSTITLKKALPFDLFYLFAVMSVLLLAAGIRSRKGHIS